MKPCPISCPDYSFAGLCKHNYPDSRTYDPKKNLVEDIMAIIEKYYDLDGDIEFEELTEIRKDLIKLLTDV